MRIARIWPGLIACLILTVLVVGLMVTTLENENYLTAMQTRLYILNNMQLSHIDYQLPGVFKENHYRSAVNGSLWTLPVEIRCYVVVFFAGVFGFLKDGKKTILLVLALILIALVFPDSLGYLQVVNETARLPLIFLLGMVCYTNRTKISIDWRLSIVAIIFALMFDSTIIGKVSFYLFLLNTVLVLGSCQCLRRFKPLGDYSYGIYIYGFVVQQTVAYYFPWLESYPSLFISIPVAFMMGFVSWKCFERPALNFARSLSFLYENQRLVAVEGRIWL
jgi:peptidoglycan/LPS O-acetylase OafA/YrhL